MGPPNCSWISSLFSLNSLHFPTLLVYQAVQLSDFATPGQVLLAVTERSSRVFTVPTVARRTFVRDPVNCDVPAAGDFKFHWNCRINFVSLCWETVWFGSATYIVQKASQSVMAKGKNVRFEF